LEVKIGRGVSCSIAIPAARGRRAGSHANARWTWIRRVLSWMLRVVVMGLSCIAQLHDRKCGTDSWERVDRRPSGVAVVIKRPPDDPRL
jgi:hypothetical protein